MIKKINNQNTSDVKERIVREGMKLFLAKGFHGTSVKEITEAAGIGRGTLYWYFKSKDEIVQNIINRFETEFVDGLIMTVNNCEGNFIKKYRAFHKFATEFARDNKYLALVFNAILNEIVGTKTKAEKLVKAVYEKYRNFLEQMIEHGKHDGSVKLETDSTLYAHIIIASHAGMLVEWFVFGNAFNVGDFVKIYREVILNGLKK